MRKRQVNIDLLKTSSHVHGRSISAHPAGGGLHLERRRREGGFGILIILLFREILAADRIQHGYHRLYHGALRRCQPDIMNQQVQPIAARRQVADDEPRILRDTLLGDQIRICCDEQRRSFACAGSCVGLNRRRCHRRRAGLAIGTVRILCDSVFQRTGHVCTVIDRSLGHGCFS